MSAAETGARRHGKATVPANDEASVLLVEAPLGTNGFIEALYAKWAAGVVTLLIVDGALWTEPIEYTVGSSDKLEHQRPPIFFYRMFEVRAQNHGGVPVLLDATVMTRWVHDNRTVPPSRIRVAPNKALRRKFMRRP